MHSQSLNWARLRDVLGFGPLDLKLGAETSRSELKRRVCLSLSPTLHQDLLDRPLGEKWVKV
eukprot:6193086-Pleurochrysis_carterae.AAC.2